MTPPCRKPVRSTLASKQPLRACSPMFLAPFVCDNPAAQCTTAPGLRFLNQAVGCLNLDKANAGCLIKTCNTMQRGYTCPAVPVGKALRDWDSDIAAQTELSSPCTTFYLSRLQAVLDTVPLDGCTGACTGVGVPAGTTGCCASTQTPVGSSSTSPTTAWRLTDAVATPANPQAVIYQNFLNTFRTCMLQQNGDCAVPVGGLSKGGATPALCNGHGVCEPTGTEGDFNCACAQGYSGKQCQHGGSTMCPISMNMAFSALEPCGGATHGKCDPTTNTCTCTPLWSGPGCSEPNCASSGGLLCSGRGVCMFSTGKCACGDTGFNGAACQCVASTKVCAPLDKPSRNNSSAPGSEPNNDNAVTQPSNTTSHSTLSRTRMLVLVVGGGITLLLATIVALVVHRWRRGKGGGTHAASTKHAAKSLDALLQEAQQSK